MRVYNNSADQDIFSRIATQLTFREWIPFEESWRLSFENEEEQFQSKGTVWFEKGRLSSDEGRKEAPE